MAETSQHYDFAIFILRIFVFRNIIIFMKIIIVYRICNKEDFLSYMSETVLSGFFRFLWRGE